MIEESAKIIAVEKGWLRVQAQPSSACGGCHARSACGQGLLSKYFNQTPGQISVENRLPNGEALSVIEGDEVIIGLRESSVVSGAFYAYLLPLFFVVAFALLAQVLGIKSEWQQILVVLTGLGLGVAVVRFLFNGNQKHLRNMLPILLRKVQSGKITLQEV